MPETIPGTRVHCIFGDFLANNKQIIIGIQARASERIDGLQAKRIGTHNATIEFQAVPSDNSEARSAIIQELLREILNFRGNIFSDISFEYDCTNNFATMKVGGIVRGKTLNWIRNNYGRDSVLYFFSSQVRAYTFNPYAPIHIANTTREQKHKRPSEISEIKWNSMSGLVQEYITREVDPEDV